MYTGSLIQRLILCKRTNRLLWNNVKYFSTHNSNKNEMNNDNFLQLKEWELASKEINWIKPYNQLVDNSNSPFTR